MAMVKKYIGRIKHVHLKDIRREIVDKVKAENMSFLDGVRAGAFTIPGDGCIDFEPIFKVLEDAGYEGYMLVEAEQDPAKVLADSLVGQQGVPEELYQEFLQDITMEIDRENKIITDLLSLVKLDKKASDLRVEHLHIDDLLELILKS